MRGAGKEKDGQLQEEKKVPDPFVAKVEGVDWQEGMRHAMKKPKPKDWDETKDVDEEEPENGD